MRVDSRTASKRRYRMVRFKEAKEHGSLWSEANKRLSSTLREKGKRGQIDKKRDCIKENKNIYNI